MAEDKFARLRAKLAAVHLGATVTKANSTKKEPNVHDLNRKVEGKLTEVRSSTDIANDLLRREFVAEEWIPDAYVLFTRRWRCRCGQSGTCLDRPELFLRHHHIRQRKRAESDHGPTVRYIPVKVLAFAHLPRLKEVQFRSLVVCEACFETREALTICLQKPSPSVQVDIVGTPESPEASTDLLESAFQRQRKWSTEEVERDWLQYASMEKNLNLFACASSSSVTSAPATDMTSHITEDLQNV